MIPSYKRPSANPTISISAVQWSDNGKACLISDRLESHIFRGHQTLHNCHSDDHLFVSVKIALRSEVSVRLWTPTIIPWRHIITVRTRDSKIVIDINKPVTNQPNDIVQLQTHEGILNRARPIRIVTIGTMLNRHLSDTNHTDPQLTANGMTDIDDQQQKNLW
jgi:hypothetical protein